MRFDFDFSSIDSIPQHVKKKLVKRKRKVKKKSLRIVVKKFPVSYLISPHVLVPRVRSVRYVVSDCPVDRSGSGSGFFFFFFFGSEAEVHE